MLTFADSIAEQAKATIDELRSRGLMVCMVCTVVSMAPPTGIGLTCSDR